MKQIAFFILLFLPSTWVMAQADSIKIWNNWCSRADTPLVFATANNVIKVYSRTIAAKDMVFKSLDNALKIGKPEISGDTVSFMAMPYPKYGKRMRLTVTDSKTRKLLKTVNFTAGDAPEPVARLGTIATTEAKKKDILDQNVLRVAFPNSLYDYPYRIKEYTFKTRIAGKDILIPVKGFFITTEIMTVLSNAPLGAFIEFTNIKATCPECNTRSLPDIKMWVR